MAAYGSTERNGADMRHLYDDAAFFQLLDEMDEPAAPVAIMRLTCEFPMMRSEEARAVYCDWLASRRPIERPCDPPLTIHPQ